VKSSGTKVCSDGRIRTDTYGAVERSNFLLRMGSDIVSGVFRWDSRFFDGEMKR
jgi:hypothetical protein